MGVSNVPIVVDMPKKNKSSTQRPGVAQPNTPLHNFLHWPNRTKDAVIDDTVIREAVTSLITKMNAAVERDALEWKSERPMMNRMVLLPTVTKVLWEPRFAKHFVCEGGYKIMATWLCPSSDGIMPNEHLRSEILRCLLRLPVIFDEVKKSGIDSIVENMIFGNPEETFGNRSAGRKLCAKWLQDTFERDAQLKPESKFRPTTNTYSRKNASSSKTVPIGHRVLNVLKNMKKTNQHTGPWRPYKMSVTGNTR